MLYLGLPSVITEVEIKGILVAMRTGVESAAVVWAATVIDSVAVTLMVVDSAVVVAPVLDSLVVTAMVEGSVVVVAPVVDSIVVTATVVSFAVLVEDAVVGHSGDPTSVELTPWSVESKVTTIL